jgi:hypothetical protein
MPKTATAIRTGGDNYDLYYHDTRTLDNNVPYAYLLGTVKAGYTIEVDQRNHRGEGEPPLYKMEPSNPD